VVETIEPMNEMTDRGEPRWRSHRPRSGVRRRSALAQPVSGARVSQDGRSRLFRSGIVFAEDRHRDGLEGGACLLETRGR